MKRIVIALFLCGGLLVGCDSNKKSSRSFSGKRSTAAQKAAEPSNSASAADSGTNVSVSISAEEAELDSILKEQDNSSRRPGMHFNSASGPGTGGSYASHAYRHEELNRKKYAKQALAKKREADRINKNLASAMKEDSLTVQSELSADSLSTQADSTQYVW